MLPPEPSLHSDIYWRRVRQIAKQLHSNGCSGVPDFYVEACWEHDIHYLTGRTLGGKRVTRCWADARFRRVIQSRSRFGRLSPMAWWRWAGVRFGGWKSWGKYRAGESNDVS